MNKQSTTHMILYYKYFREATTFTQGHLYSPKNSSVSCIFLRIIPITFNVYIKIYTNSLLI